MGRKRTADVYNERRGAALPGVSEPSVETRHAVGGMR
jgi:hypothetical protein